MGGRGINGDKGMRFQLCLSKKKGGKSTKRFGNFKRSVMKDKSETRRGQRGHSKEDSEGWVEAFRIAEGSGEVR